jgi:hypothetical protein
MWFPDDVDSDAEADVNTDGDGGSDRDSSDRDSSDRDGDSSAPPMGGGSGCIGLDPQAVYAGVKLAEKDTVVTVIDLEHPSRARCSYSGAVSDSISQDGTILGFNIRAIIQIRDDPGAGNPNDKELLTGVDCTGKETGPIFAYPDRPGAIVDCGAKYVDLYTKTTAALSSWGKLVAVGSGDLTLWTNSSTVSMRGGATELSMFIMPDSHQLMAVRSRDDGFLVATQNTATHKDIRLFSVSSDGTPPTFVSYSNPDGLAVRSSIVALGATGSIYFLTALDDVLSMIVRIDPDGSPPVILGRETSPNLSSSVTDGFSIYKALTFITGG